MLINFNGFLRKVKVNQLSAYKFGWHYNRKGVTTNPTKPISDKYLQHIKRCN